MSPETLEALKGSIEKWDKIAAGAGVDEGVGNCPLCQLFWHVKDGCGDCPVKQATKQNYCSGSPYNEWEREGFRSIAQDDASDAELALRLSVQEAEFLRSLLPKEETA
jgi:hypothetical protein